MARTTVGNGRETKRAGENGHWGPIAHVAAEKFKDRNVLTSEGHAGRVVELGVAEDGQYYAAVDFGAELGLHEIPLAKLAYENNRFLLPETADNDVRLMPMFSEGHLRSVTPDTMLDIRGYQRADDASIHVQHAAAQVRVERPALAIHWEQPAAEVTVHQPTPQVHVRQMRPVITVRQPPPVITVELEQPEIVVSMSEPEVDVSISEAQVQVNIPKPNVQVLQPDKPMLDFIAREPVVSLAPRAQAEVAFEHAEPLVQYERMGEPKVIFRQAEGGPRVRYEDRPREESLRAVSSAANAEPMEIPASPPGLTIPQIEGREVFDAHGEKVGTIGRVLVDQRGDLFFVLERGGILARKRLLSIDRLAISGARFIIPGLTDAELRKLSDWDERMDTFAPVAADSSVHISRYE